MFGLCGWRPEFQGMSPQNMALYATVPSFYDPEILIDPRHVQENLLNIPAPHEFQK